MISAAFPKEARRRASAPLVDSHRREVPLRRLPLPHYRDLLALHLELRGVVPRDELGELPPERLLLERRGLPQPLGAGEDPGPDLLPGLPVVLRLGPAVDDQRPPILPEPVPASGEPQDRPLLPICGHLVERLQRHLEELVGMGPVERRDDKNRSSDPLEVVRRVNPPIEHHDHLFRGHFEVHRALLQSIGDLSNPSAPSRLPGSSSVSSGRLPTATRPRPTGRLSYVLLLRVPSGGEPARLRFPEEVGGVQEEEPRADGFLYEDAEDILLDPVDEGPGEVPSAPLFPFAVAEVLFEVPSECSRRGAVHPGQEERVRRHRKPLAYLLWAKGLLPSGGELKEEYPLDRVAIEEATGTRTRNASERPISVAARSKVAILPNSKDQRGSPGEPSLRRSVSAVPM